MRRAPIGFGAWIAWAPDFLDDDAADALLRDCLARDDWAQLPIQAGPKQVMQPRLMTWAGDVPYRYAGLTMDPRPFDPALARLRDRLSACTGVPLNHVVLNLYRDGRDHIRMHADDEPELGHEPLVASVSVGAMRTFHFHAKRKRRLKRRMRMVHGSLLVTGGAFQHTWYHGVPAEPEVTRPRVNLTFRAVSPPA